MSEHSDRKNNQQLENNGELKASKSSLDEDIKTEAALAEAEPVEANPVDAEPVEAESAEAKPVEAELAEAEPVAAEPVEAEPVDAEPAEVEPAEAEPVDAEPAEVEPAEAEPVDAEPAEAESVDAEPVETDQAEAESAEAEPAEADPVEAEPTEAESAEAKPVEADPVDAEPAEAESAEAKLVEAESAEAESAEAEPVEAEPVEAESAEVEPAEAESAEAEAVEAEPVEAESVEAESVDAEPAEAESAEAEPVEAEPAEDEPVDADPVDAEPVEAEPVEAESAEAESVDAEPAEAEPVADDPVDAEPAEVEPVEVIPQRPWLKHYDAEIPHSIHYPDINVAQLLIDTAAHYPTNKAVEFLGNTLTYEQLYLKADQLAKYLVSVGVKKGERVAIMLPNTPQAVIAYYGVLLAGAIVVQTNPLYVERELKYQLKDSGAVALITVDLLINRVKNVRGERLEHEDMSFLKTVIVTSIADGLAFPKNALYRFSQRKKIPRVPDSSYGYVAWRSIFKRDINYERPKLASGNEIAVIQYTGGTTGTPKGVMLSHHNLVANTLQTGAWCYKAKKGNERFLAALPLFHVFGLTVLMNYSVSQAGLLILLPKFEVDQVLKTIEEKRPTIFPGAPTMYIAVLQAAAKAKQKLDLSSINICISGSAALPLEVQEQFEGYTGGRLVEGYGLTETSPVSHANPIWGTRKIGTIGVPFPDTEAAIIDPVSGKFLPPNEIGEVVIKGPQVMLGYWNKPEATNQSFINGWLRTGDMGKMDEDGFFSIVDRIKDIIIASGFNIYPREIEEVLYEHPAIAEAAAVGIHDKYRGETVKAFIVKKEGASVTEQELDQYCRSKLAAFKVPQYYEFRESLPKTMVGKILKRQLQEK